MLKKTITYQGFDGKQYTEDFFFNLTKAEATEMELSQKGGMKKYMEDIVAAENGEEIIRIFKEIILKSYGVKSEDGKRFIKSEELSREFSQTLAYDQLFMLLATDEQAALAFLKAVLPKELSEEVDKSIKNNN